MAEIMNGLGAEGLQEHREEALEKIRSAHFTIQGNTFEFRGSNRIRIKGLQIFIEFEYDGLPQSQIAIFRS